MVYAESRGALAVCPSWVPWLGADFGVAMSHTRIVPLSYAGWGVVGAWGTPVGFVCKANKRKRTSASASAQAQAQAQARNAIAS